MRIAIKALTNSTVDSLKTEAMYFDRIEFDVKAYNNSAAFMDALIKASGPLDENLQQFADEFYSSQAEIELLVDRGILVPRNAFGFAKESKDVEEGIEIPAPFLAKMTVPEREQFFELFKHAFIEEIAEQGEHKRKIIDDVAEYQKKLATRSTLKAMLLTITNMNSIPEHIFTPICSDDALEERCLGVFTERAVMNLVLKKYPIPERDVEWDRIFEFRNDPECQEQLYRLRRWIKATASSSSNISEAEEEIEHLMREYEKNLRTHSLKFRFKSLELFITTPLEIIEHIVKLNWSKAAKTLFQLRQNKIDFLMERDQLIGREVAFVHRLRHQLHLG